MKKVVKFLESVRARPNMFMGQPFEVESFLFGIHWAYRILEFLQDEAVVKQAFAEFEIETVEQRLQQPGDYTWDFIDKILQSEIAS